MQYFVTFDQDGNIKGFYLDTIHVKIPDDAIPITKEDWELYVEDTNVWKYDNGVIRKKTQQELDDEEAARPKPPLTTEDQLRLEMARSNAELFETMLALMGGV